MEHNELLDAFERLLSGSIAPHIRNVEKGGAWIQIWGEISDSGFLDALMAEEAGGTGLGLEGVAPLLHAIGRFGVPLPIAETMAARALVTPGTVAAGDVVVLALPVNIGGVLMQRAVPCGLLASHALIDLGDRLIYSDLAQARKEPVGVNASLAADIMWAAPPEGKEMPGIEIGLRPLAAVLRSALIAGAAERLLEMTIEYAIQRVQFGKPIGRQQAIQQQLAVMAEQVVAARSAALIGSAGGLAPSLLRAGVAKLVTSSYAGAVAATAHAVHGAIGFSEEYDLQLFTRLLYEWRIADGSEGFWAERIGVARIATPDLRSSDFIRCHL